MYAIVRHGSASVQVELSDPSGERVSVGVDVSKSASTLSVIPPSVVAYASSLIDSSEVTNEGNCEGERKKRMGV